MRTQRSDCKICNLLSGPDFSAARGVPQGSRCEAFRRSPQTYPGDAERVQVLIQRKASRRARNARRTTARPETYHQDRLRAERGRNEAMCKIWAWQRRAAGSGCDVHLQWQPTVIMGGFVRVAAGQGTTPDKRAKGATRPPATMETQSAGMPRRS